MSTTYNVRCDLCGVDGPRLQRSAGGVSLWDDTPPWGRFLIDHEYHPLALVQEHCTPLTADVPPGAVVVDQPGQYVDALGYLITSVRQVGKSFCERHGVPPNDWEEALLAKADGLLAVLKRNQRERPVT